MTDKPDFEYEECEECEEGYEANRLPLETLAERVKGELSVSRHKEDRALEMDNWLRWGQSDEPESRKRWAWLTEPTQGLDRDKWVLKLWQTIEKDREIRTVIEGEVPWSFYQRHFFGWFLGRFNVQAARAVFVSWRWRLAGWLHYLLALVIVVGTFVSLQWPASPIPSFQVFLALLGFLVVVGFIAARSGLPLYAYFNSLIPRLAAAVGIGYIFLFSAPHLVQMINVLGEPTRNDWLTVVALSLAPLLYIMFHIHRRVDPPLKFSSLLRRSSSVLVLAISYSALELLVAAPILFSSSFLCGVTPNEGCLPHPNLHHLALCAAIALNLGVVLQLAWDEKPLTEPL
jgi:hypothetical protein